MTNSRSEIIRTQLLQLTDGTLIWFAFWLGWAIRNFVRLEFGMGLEESEMTDSLNWVLYVAIPLTPVILERMGFYKSLRTKRAGASVGQLIRTMFIMLLIIGAIAIFTKQLDTRRLALGSGLLMSFLLIITRDWLTRIWYRRISSNEDAKENVVIAGTGREMQDFLNGMDKELTATWHISKLFDLETQNMDGLFDILKKDSVSRVIFVTKQTDFEKVSQAVEICELQGVEAWISASFIRTQIARPVFDSLADRPMLVLRSTPELSWEMLFKSFIDWSVALLAILFTLPLWIFAIIGIRIASPGSPAFFSQLRAGRYGRPFRMWKFRTMVPNAEELLDQVKEQHGNQMDGPVFKLDKDPRIFAFGDFLRKLSIDELPQLLNVLKGDMSLVGPRPLPLYEVEAFSEITHRRRLSVKPGITCEWQAGGRNKITSFDQWVEMDLRYIDNWSLWLDFTILVRTIPAVLFRRGAK
jgi:exopolysaccharide biosynthesis polyprenyl glycosylphosphotransferase